MHPTLKRIKKAGGAVSRIRHIMRAAGKISFNEIEDSPVAISAIRSIASAAVRRAIWENKKLRLPRTELRGKALITITRDGNRIVISDANPSTAARYKKGQVLYARKSKTAAGVSRAER